MREAPIIHKRSAYPRDHMGHMCDHMGYMNVAAYVETFDNAAWNFMTERGPTRSYREQHGIGLADHAA